ncbi:hypothetical protein [Roseimicrobium gellanilyticum]|uniref:hypothetical protein n=1 Tax=Roseimicrobium gellanilyticum TaxID=748857 RepID=UPI0011BE1BEE|nr:hypothetical protein [Roseimicrobium gellanilyticum]
MRTCFSALVASILFTMVVSCSAPRRTLTKTPVAALATNAPASKVQPSEAVATIAQGTLATRYDRDGDGVFEEARRADTTYFDRNSDGFVDLVQRGGPPQVEYQWDADFDQVLDIAITSHEGAVFEWEKPRPIRIPASRIFLDDRTLQIRKQKAEDVRYKFIEQLLESAPS